MRQEPEQRRKDLLDLLLAHLNEFVITLADSDGYFTTWHPGIEHLFGYTADEFIGKHMEILLPPPDRARGDAARELREAAQNGRSSDTRWLVNKSGQRIFVEGITIALEENKKLLGFGKVLRDVTEQKNADDSLRALTSALEQSTVMVHSFDATINHWTLGCERLYGWTAKEAVGKNAHELLKTTFPEPLESINRKLMIDGTWQGELGHVCHDGKRVFVSALWVLSPGVDEAPPIIVATHTDITERVEVQRELEVTHDELKRMALELERSNEELEEFARIASHDLSAPITSTRWLVDLLSRRHSRQLDAAGQEALKKITFGLERMADLVQGILAHAQVGKSAIGSSESTSANRALDVAIDNLRVDIENSKAVIHHATLPDLQVEPQALTRLFQNLLSNAIKYRRPEAKPEIAINAGRQGSMWLFSVEDNGIGIEPAWHERIFQPMQRHHGIEIAGSGIGLATCKKIVTRAGGRIWVESRVGSGSKFLFTLPGPDTPAPKHEGSDDRASDAPPP